MGMHPDGQPVRLHFLLAAAVRECSCLGTPCTLCAAVAAVCFLTVTTDDQGHG